MLSNINVINSRSLGKVWRLANNVPDPSSDVDLTGICSSLNKWVVSGRMSLRTSSVLLNGAAKVYKEKVDELFEDLFPNVDENTIYSNSELTQDVTVSDSESDSSKEDSREGDICQNRDPKGHNNNKERQSLNRSRKRSSQRNRSDDLDISTSSASKRLCSGIQTRESFTANKKRKEIYKRKQTKNSPYSLTLVYDTESVISTKVIYSKINTNVNL